LNKPFIPKGRVKRTLPTPVTVVHTGPLATLGDLFAPPAAE
jgi:hypothetical protein